MANFVSAFRDVREGLRLAPIWLSLGWDQTVGRFRRTLLGPFWLSSGLLAMAIALSFVFGALLGMDWRASFPLVLLGILSWSVVGGVLAEAAMLFVNAGQYMQLQKLPLSFHVFLHMYRVIINFAAQFVVAIIVLLVLGLMTVPHWSFLVALPIVLVNSALLSFIVAIPSTRFRDLAQAVLLIIPVLFFLTPIFWSAEHMSPNRRMIVDYNPLAHEVALLREPLMGRAPDPANWAWGLGLLAVSAVVAFIMLAIYRRRVIFWL